MQTQHQIRCFEVYDYFQAHSHQLRDVDFLTTFLAPHCTNKVASMRGSRLRLLQIPSELARFLVFMAEQEIRSYFELGVSTGGSWFMIDSYLRAAHPSFARSVGCDRTAKLRDWHEYQTRFPSAEFRHVHSGKLVMNEHFDMSFIDAKHTAEWARKDFLTLAPWSKFVGFHDIVLPGATVSTFWNEVKQNYRSWEFVDASLPKTAGIGVVQVSD